jgi:hypothetical protein
LLSLPLLILAGWTAPLEAGIFGVPTQIASDGQVCTGVNTPVAGCPGAALDPPGYLILTGVDDVDAAGDTVHQMRLFIEVTGTTLDVRVFDAGRSGSRDNPQNDNTSFTYQLFDPAGTLLKSIAIGGDSGVTQNRLARMSSAAADTTFVALNAGTAFATTPGLYELRITAQNGSTTNDRNSFGVDIRDGTGANAGHYNVYTWATDNDVGQGSTPAASDTSLVIGALQSGSNGGTITQQMVFYPYVTRDCSLQTSNYDMDSQAGASATTTDILGASTSLTVSGPTVDVVDTVTIHTSGLAAGASNDVINYGLYSLRNHTGNQFNIIDWRLADFRGFADNPANLPPDPTDPLRTFLPNGYTGGVPPLTNATPPGEPVLTASYAYVSGANPPAVGSTTRFVVQVELTNASPAAVGLNAANDQIVSGLPAGATNLGNIRCFEGSFSNNVGTPVDGGTFARCSFSGAGLSLSSGASVILSYEFDYTPAAAGAFFITNVPAAPASGTYNTGGLAPNSTTWAQYSRFPTGTVRAETLGPICDLRAQTGAAVTRATLGGLRVDPSGGLEFTSLGQRRTAGFNVYATHDASGRGARTLLSAEPLRAPVADSLGPVRYRLESARITAPYVLLEEIEATGRRRFLGPFRAGDPRMGDALERSLAASMVPAAGEGARAAAARTLPPLRGSTVGVKVEVDAPGRVVLALAELRAQGLPDRISPQRLTLTSQGSEVPFDLVRGDDGAVEAIAFDNPGLSTAYTGTNVFIVSWGRTRPALLVDLTRFDEPPRPGWIRVEKDRYYAPGAPLGGDPWIWDYAIGGEAWPRADDPDSGLFDLPALGAAPGSTLPVRVRVSAVTGGAHEVRAFINGVPVGSLTFAGRRAATLAGEIAADALQTLGNTLSLEYAADSAEGGLLYLGHLELGAASAEPPAPVPARLSPYAPGVGVRRFAGVDYLIVTHGDFRGQAQEIAGLKRSAGHRVAVVGVEEAYDQYSTGITEAEAIARLIADVARLRSLRHVLLVGDDSFDPLGRLAGSTRSFVPSLYAWDPEFGRVPSENRYADVDGDLVPDVAIGRLPVQDEAGAGAMVAKIARRATAPAPAGRQVFAVDNQAPGDPSFEELAEQGRSALGSPEVAWARLSDGIDAAREALRQGLLAGPPAVHFFGHASFEAWADERLLDTASVAELSGSPETVVFAWSCESQWFLWPFGPSLGEALLLLPEGGAAASFGPAGITAPGVQGELMAEVYPRFFGQGLTLGEAVRRAKAAALARDPFRLAPVVHGWNLLGDPSLR